MTGLSIDSRVVAARELLLGWENAEYDTLPPEAKAAIQDAIEHLSMFEETMAERGRKK